MWRCIFDNIFTLKDVQSCIDMDSITEANHWLDIKEGIKSILTPDMPKDKKHQ